MTNFHASHSKNFHCPLLYSENSCDANYFKIFFINEAQILSKIYFVLVHNRNKAMEIYRLDEENGYSYKGVKQMFIIQNNMF